MKWSPCTQRLHFALSLESDQYLSWVPNKGRGYILHSVHLSYQVPRAVIINLVRTNLSHEIVLYLFCCLAKYYKFSCRKSMCSQLCRSKAQVNPAGVLLRVSQGWNQNLHWLDSQLEAWGKHSLPCFWGCGSEVTGCDIFFAGCHLVLFSAPGDHPHQLSQGLSIFIPAMSPRVNLPHAYSPTYSPVYLFVFKNTR